MWLHRIQNFVDLDACKQLFVLNSYKSAITNFGKKRNVLKKNVCDLSQLLNLIYHLNQTTLEAVIDILQYAPQRRVMQRNRKANDGNCLMQFKTASSTYLVYRKSGSLVSKYVVCK